MMRNVDDGVVEAIRSLYQREELAQRLFDMNAKRGRDASASSIDVIARKLETSRGEALRLARELESTGCGKFVVGRRGSTSRFEWSFSCIVLGKAAAGEMVELEQAHNPEEEEDLPESTLTIQEAKLALARSLGVSADQIEIRITA